MKQARRLISLAAALLLATGMVGMTGCGDKPAESTGGSSQTETSTTQQEAVDLGGYNFVIGTKWTEGFGNTEEGKSDSSDLWIQWKRDFEKNYHCTVEVQAIELFTLFESLAPRIMSGEKVADLLQCQMMDVEKFRHAGLLRAWQDIPHINMVDWEGEIGTDVNTFNGKTYMIFGGVPTVNTGVLVNRSMLKRLNLDDPFEMVKNKTWTLDKMRDMAKAATVDNGDGIWDKEDQYGLGMWSNFITGMLKSNGVNIIEQVDGQMQYGLSNPKAVEILKLLKDFALNDQVEYPINRDTHAEYMEKFFAGKILFVTVPANFPSQYPEMKDMKDDYGFLPAPTLNEGEEYSFLLEHWTAGYAVPTSSTEIDKIGYLVNSFVPVIKQCNELYWDEQARDYRDHEETIDILKMLVANVRTDYFADQAFIAPAQVMLLDCVYNANVEPASGMESIREQMEAAVKDYYKEDPDLGAK